MFHGVASKYTAHGSQAEREALQGQLDELYKLKRMPLKGDEGEGPLIKLQRFAAGLTRLIDAVLDQASCIPCIIMV